MQTLVVVHDAGERYARAHFLNPRYIRSPMARPPHTPGGDWERQIDEEPDRADLILLLVSADFLNSDYRYDIEVRRAIERHDTGEARVIPVIIRDVSWHAAPFGKCQALPKEATSV